MKFLKKFTLLLLAVLLLLTASLPLPALSSVSGHATQTILVYIVGSDLESEHGMATADIREMLGAKPDPERLNVLLMTGGTQSWAAKTIPADKLSIYRIEGNNPRLLHQMESASMGDTATLNAFMDYAVANFPAQSYGLIFWDHGGGPMGGIGADTLYEQDGLSLEELKIAFERGPFKGEQRLEWLAFDACLMASMEVAAALSPYARYMVASEETLPGRGFDYGFLKDLGETNLSGREVGKAIIDRTGAYYERLALEHPGRKDLVTLSLLDLDRLPPALQALEQLFSDLSQGLQARIYSDIARRRDGTKAYGRTGTTSEFDLIDLYDLAGNMEALYPDKAQDLQEAIEGLVIHNHANVPRSRGLSIYFPLLNKPMFERSWADMYQRFGHSPAYARFVRDFGAILLSDRLSSWTGSETPVLSYDEQAAEYFIQLTPNQAQHYERAEFYVLTQLAGEEFMLNYMSSDVTLDENQRLRANFDGKVMSFREQDSQADVFPYLVEKENLDGVARYQIPALLNRRTQEGALDIVHAEMLVEIDKVSGAAAVIGAIRSEADEHFLGKRDLNLDEFDSVYLPYVSFFLTRGKAGETLPLGDWVASDIPRLASFSAGEPLNVRYEPLTSQGLKHFMLISVTDTQGFSYSSDLIPLELPQSADNQTSAPAVAEFDFPQASQPRDLFDRDGLAATLFGFDFSAAETGDRLAPDTLHMKLLLENKRSKALQVDLDWLGANRVMVDAQGSVLLEAGGQAVMSIDIPIAPLPGGTSLVDAGISELDSLRFRLKYRLSDTNIFSESFSDEVLIRTDLQVGAGYTRPEGDPEGTRLLEESHGFTIEQYGQPYISDGDYRLRLRITNASEEFDRLDLTHATINSIAAPLYLPSALPRGYTRHAVLSIPVARTVLGEDLQEYQYLFDGLDNLEALGITRVQQLWLEFAAGSSLSGGAAPVYLPSVFVNFKQKDENFEQELDTKGEIIFEAGNVKLVRLDSDPEGKRFYIYNFNEYGVRLTSFGRVKVDGADYSDSMPILQIVPRFQSAYTLLFGFLPGIFPEGEELSFTLNLIHQEENRLLLQSDPITIDLR